MNVWHIGDVKISRIVELETVGGTRFILPDAAPDAVLPIKWLYPHFMNEKGKLIMSVHALVIDTGSRRIIVDTCIGNEKERDIPSWNNLQTTFLSDLENAGYARTDIDTVLCTHLHVDHVGWNTQLIDGRWVPTFASAKYLMPKADNAVFGEAGSDSYFESVAPIIAAGQAELVGPEHKLGDHVTLIATPGHTPGHVSVLLQCDDAQAIITGDALHTTAQCWHPDWVFKYDMNGGQAVTSRKSLLQSASESGCAVIGSHFSLPSIGRVRAKGDAFEWDPDS